MKTLRFLLPVALVLAVALSLTGGVAFARNMTETRAFEGHSQEIEFSGMVESMSADAWTIAGRQLAVTSETEISSSLVVGDAVKVHAIAGLDGSLTAREIEPAGADKNDDSEGEMGNETEFTGTVTAITPEVWTIAGQAVTVLQTTEIKDTIVVGDLVKVHARVAADGSLSAREIEAVMPDDDSGEMEQEAEFSGVVEAISGQTWVISGKTVTILPSTEIKGDIAIGDMVKVHAQMSADGSLTAREIEPAQSEDHGGDRQNSGHEQSGSHSANDSSPASHDDDHEDSGSDD